MGPNAATGWTDDAARAATATIDGAMDDGMLCLLLRWTFAVSQTAHALIRGRTSNLKRRRKERPDGLIERARAHHARVSITSNANELIQAEKDRGGHRDPLANLLFF